MNKNKNSTRLGVDRVKPGNSVRINLFLGLRGPDIRLGLNNRHLILEGHRRSWKVMESQGRSRKVMDGLFQSLDWHIRWEKLWVDGVVLGGVVACRIIVSVPVPFLFLWTLDLEPGFGTGFGLDKKDGKNSWQNIVIDTFIVLTAFEAL